MKLLMEKIKRGTYTSMKMLNSLLIALERIIVTWLRQMEDLIIRMIIILKRPLPIN